MQRRKKSARLSPHVRRCLAFEQALHRWKPWLASVLEGKKLLRVEGLPAPNLPRMREVAKNTLLGLAFPPCTVLELYWLCCVFVDYKAKVGFRFDNLIPPDWFPFPFGFNHEESYLFEGCRIYPPEVWDEADRVFWFERQPVLPTSQKEWEDDFNRFPNREFVMLLAPDHPVRKFIKKGRPIKATATGETILE